MDWTVAKTSGEAHKSHLEPPLPAHPPTVLLKMEDLHTFIRKGLSPSVVCLPWVSPSSFPHPPMRHGVEQVP